MGKRIPIPDVNAVLFRIKMAVSAGRYQFVGRQKNLRSMATAGILPDHVKQFILGLTYKEYLCGPEVEIDGNFPAGDIFLFGLFLNGVDFLVKLKLFCENSEDWCVCISFHDAERPLHYPY